MTYKTKYHYKGYVKHFQHWLSYDWEAFTEAVSEKQAINNIKAKAKKAFNLAFSASIDIDESKVKVYDDESDIENQPSVPKCDKCGRRLNDNGECPLCDLGDESVLQEKIVKKGSKWQVQSEDGTKNLGTYDTKEEAEKRLKQVHYFKHMKEDLQEADNDNDFIYDVKPWMKGKKVADWGIENKEETYDWDDPAIAHRKKYGKAYFKSRQGATELRLYFTDGKEATIDVTDESLRKDLRNALGVEKFPGNYTNRKSIKDLNLIKGVENFILSKGFEIDYKKPEEYNSFLKKAANLEEDYQKKFDERTHAHIDRVNKYAKKINKEYPHHDEDKFNELYEGYSLMSKDKEDITKEEQALIDDATFKHVINNEHHCEHWVDPKDIEGFSRDNPTPHGCLDCSKMPNDALEEMCCDWCAMSEEFNNTPFEWYTKNKDTRWHFNEEQDKFIQDTLHKLWDVDLEEELKEIKVANNENIEKDAEECPLPLDIIPNNMGINLSNVEKVAWEEQEDGQLKKVEIDFNPGDDLEEDIEKHDTLNPKLFDGEELKPEVKDKIEQIAYQFIRELNEDGIRFTLKDIVLLGSNVSYNYTKDSDLDIHLIADSNGLECPDDLYPLLYSAYRSMFNKNYDIRIKGIPSEIYVEMDEPLAKSNGIYSLNNGWLKKPEQRDIPDLDKEAFNNLFNEWERKYLDLIGDKDQPLLTEDNSEEQLDEYEIRKGSTILKSMFERNHETLKTYRTEIEKYTTSLSPTKKDKSLLLAAMIYLADEDPDYEIYMINSTPKDIVLVNKKQLENHGFYGNKDKYNDIEKIIWVTRQYYPDDISRDPNNYVLLNPSDYRG